jgi:copper(I)-binding protein
MVLHHGRSPRPAAWWLTACILMLPVFAADGPGDLVISDAWARATPPSSSVGAVYLTIRNRGPRPDRLTGVSSPLAASAAIHESVSRNGMVGMDPVPELALPAGATVQIKPGGLHIMLLGLKRALAPGESFPLVLVFAAAGTVTVPVSVRAGGD